MEQHYSLDWLIEKFDKGENLKYLFFWGHTNKYHEEVGRFCFSQWFEAPFIVDGITYKTAEHWMMANKALLFADREAFNKIVQVDKPGEAKEIGRQVIGFDEDVWNKHRFEIVKEGNGHKFNQHKKLAEYLLGTGDRIIAEASPVDAIWGIGLAQDKPNIQNPHIWRGLNLLGFALMEVRDVLKSEIKRQTCLKQ